MSYIVYHKHSTKYLCRHPKVRTDKESFASHGAAQAAITREAKRGVINPVEFLIADAETFRKSIEKTETVINMMSGKPVQQSVNTPLCCDVSSETYWSM